MQACKLTLPCKHCQTTSLCTCCHADPKRETLPKSDKEEGKGVGLWGSSSPRGVGSMGTGVTSVPYKRPKSTCLSTY